MHHLVICAALGSIQGMMAARIGYLLKPQLREGENGYSPAQLAQAQPSNGT